MARSNILALRQRKVEFVKAQRALLDKTTTEARDFTEAESAQYEDNIKKLAANETQIEREERVLQLEASMTANADENALFRDAANGGDGKGNGNAGGVDRDAVLATWEPGKQSKGAFKGLGDQMVAIAGAAKAMTSGGRIDPRLIQAAAPNASGMNEASPADGGFLVQKDFSETLLEKTYELGNISKRVFRVPISAKANGVKINAIDEDSRTDGNRWGGVLAYWQNEADTKIASRPKFRQIELNLQKLTGLCYSTDELLEDAAALEAIIMRTFPMEFNFKVEDAIVNGTGAGQPLGIMNSGAMIEVAKAAADAGVTISTNDVLNMWQRMWSTSRPNAVWIINQDLEALLYPLTLGTGTAVMLLYTPPGQKGNNSPFGLLNGVPVIPVEYTATAGTPGDIILADFSQYVMADKGAPQAASSIHVRFINDETTFRFVYRVDGQPVWKKPLTPKNGSTTYSPFVRLATRS